MSCLTNPFLDLSTVNAHKAKVIITYPAGHDEKPTEGLDSNTGGGVQSKTCWVRSVLHCPIDGRHGHLERAIWANAMEKRTQRMQ